MAEHFNGIDLLLWTAAITQLLLVLMGAIVSLQEEWAKRHKVLVLACFAILGIAGLWATIAQSVKSTHDTTEASTKLSTALTNLGTSTTEIARMTSANTELQAKLLASSGIIADLARQTISTVTGGDSFCYFSFDSVDQGFNIAAHQQGQFPLRSALGQVTDLRKFRESLGTSQGMSPEAFLNIPTGDLSVKDARPLYTVPYPPGNIDTQNFDVYFRALNGTWFEDVRLRKVNGQWKQAIRVFKMIGTKPTILLEHNDAGYPLLRGEVDWRE